VSGRLVSETPSAVEHILTVKVRPNNAYLSVRVWYSIPAPHREGFCWRWQPLVAFHQFRPPPRAVGTTSIEANETKHAWFYPTEIQACAYIRRAPSVWFAIRCLELARYRETILSVARFAADVTSLFLVGSIKAAEARRAERVRRPPIKSIMTAQATPATNYSSTFMDNNATGPLSSFHWPPIKEIKRSPGSTGKSSPSKQTLQRACSSCSDYFKYIAHFITLILKLICWASMLVHFKYLT
jgi:hypothetical protein